MLGIILAVSILAFGIFLKTTRNEGFASSKKLSWLLIATGLITLVGKLLIMYQIGDL